MVGIPDLDDLRSIRRRAAEILRGFRIAGYPVVTLVKGRQWEIQEPEGTVMIADACGVLRLDPRCDDCQGATEEFGWLCERCQERADAVADEEDRYAHSCEECGGYTEEGSHCAECQEKLEAAAEEQFAEDYATFESERRLQ